MSSPAELVRDFVNTYDVATDTDELSSPAELAVWLRERGLTGPRERATDDDLHTAHALREGMRAALRREPATLPGLPLQVRVGASGEPELAPAGAGDRKSVV